MQTVKQPQVQGPAQSLQCGVLVYSSSTANHWCAPTTSATFSTQPSRTTQPPKPRSRSYAHYTVWYPAVPLTTCDNLHRVNNCTKQRHFSLAVYTSPPMSAFSSQTSRTTQPPTPPRRGDTHYTIAYRYMSVFMCNNLCRVSNCVKQRHSSLLL